MVKRYKIREISQPLDIETLDAVYRNADVVLAADYDALEAKLAAEHLSHSCTIAEEHASRTAFQDRIKALESQDEINWKTRRTLLAERDALTAAMATLEEWGRMDMREWCELQYRSELLTHEVIAEVEALRRGTGVSYADGRDPVKELKRTLASVDQITACRDAMRRCGIEPKGWLKP
jgi:hypothetical protein